MRSHLLVALAVLAATSTSAAHGQQRAAATSATGDISLGYNYVGANSPPGGSYNFNLNGGYISGSYGLKPWLSVAGTFTGGQSTKISTLGQDLTLMTFMGGPRFLHPMHRFTPFAEALFGGAHASNSYFPHGTSFSPTATSWALAAGGGLDIALTHRFSVRAINAEYLRTSFPNGVNDEQNQLMLSAGIVFHFGRHGEREPIPIVAEPAQIEFSCTGSVASIEQGQTLSVTGNSLTQPGKQRVTYSWSATGGSVQGSGAVVSIATTGLAPGDYNVSGHASLASSPGTEATCDVPFHVFAHAETAATAPAPTQTEEDVAFHQHVPDALFDYDSAEIRPDARQSIDRAAQYLKENPAVGVTIAGYADERGSTEYNLALAAKRADAARNALISAGVSPDRLQIISYGKEAQVCTAQTEACFQLNRRAAFNMRH